MDRIVEKIGKKFRTFGGGQDSDFNPVTAALKDKPYQFAAGVDVAAVVETVLEESGHDQLFLACEDALNNAISLSATMRERLRAALGAAERKE